MSTHRILFYSHNGFGLGHVRRNFLLARAVREADPSAEILLVTGSPFPQDPDLGERIDYLRLPAFRRVARDRWEPKQLIDMGGERLAAFRSDLLQSAVRHFRPDVIVADYLPAGVAGELLPALRIAREQGARCIAGFRDIIDEPERVRQSWSAARTNEVLDEYYDAVLVYGAQHVFDFAEYDVTPDVTKKIRYCGYLGRPRVPEGRRAEVRRTMRRDAARVVLGGTGGGADGVGVLQMLVRAAPMLERAVGARVVAVQGPLMPKAERTALAAMAGPSVEMRERVPDFSAYVAGADVVVSMCGYNTTCEVLSQNVPFVGLPREHPSLEQTMRARTLQTLGAMVMLAPEAATERDLVRAVECAMSLPRGGEPAVPLDGVANAVAAIREQL